MTPVTMEMVFVIALSFVVVITASSEGVTPVIREQPKDIVARRNDPATLNCAASNAARITWYRNGQQVVTSPQDSRSHRVLLPSGSLFFLRVTTNRRDSDAGTYWCVASNSHGATRSNNVTLSVASLGYEFEAPLEPVTKASINGSVTLPCRPPKGVPEPKLSWLKNGQEVINSSRIFVTEKGDLFINGTLKEDSGVYLCRARNLAGTRESPPTELLIMTPPWFEDIPSNMTVASGITVHLTCKAQGHPAPTVTWQKLDGKMPLDRSMIVGQDLVLEKVEPADSGAYVCKAENEAGMTSAKASLVIVDAPVMTQKPQDIQVVVDGAAELSCQVEGDPTPLILWRLPRQDRSALLTPSFNIGHISVSQDGQKLSMQRLAITDSGSYYCWGVSSGGGVSSKAEVVVVEAFPPPVVGIGPYDIEAKPGGIASFSCEAVSESAKPSISWWYRPAAHIAPHQLTEDSDNSRLSFQDNGAIILKNLQVTDSGIYSCHITAETGKIEQEAILKVSSHITETKPPKLPAPPSKPKLMSVNETSVHLTWLPNSQMKSSSEQWYVVEYWQKDWEEWRVAETDLTEESCLVSNLVPGRTYFFLVRAVNKEGISFPSPWSDPVITQVRNDLSVSEEEIRYTKRRLSRPVVTIQEGTLTSSDSIRLVWKFITSTDSNVEGVLVYIIESLKTVRLITVLGSAIYSHVRDLKPNTNYTFFLVPFWQGIEGTPSNSFSITTPEDVPLIAPSKVSVESHEDGSTLITWDTLSLLEARGEIIGYQVALSYNGTQTTETVVNPWLEARGLVPGRLYTVKVAALTKVGPGPFSAPVYMNGGAKNILKIHDSTSLNNENSSVLYAQPEPEWLAYLLVPLVIVLFLATLVYIKRLRHKPPASTVPRTPSLYQDSSIYPTQHNVQVYNEKKLWQSSDSDRDSSLSSTRLLRSNPLINEYAEPKVQQINETTEPYATTALLAPESPHLNRGPPWRHQSDDSGVQVNWSAILPPPPACPPPPQDLDLGDPLRSADPIDIHIIRSVPSKRSSASGSEQYKRPCDSTSEYSYDVYSQMTPNDSQTGYHMYNAMPVCGCVEVSVEGNSSQIDASHKT
ncbi:protein sax-3-like [Palaemon carinicauda]|uniref:protein sax-3-like n=1 Tax=Palaemon carinicauda TaxID=392227 RepID=UPI0035B5AAFD